MATETEKRNLGAHVELCAERYATMNKNLDSINKKIETLESHIVFIRDKLSESDAANSKQLVVIGTAIVGVLMSGLISFAVHLLK